MQASRPEYSKILNETLIERNENINSEELSKVIEERKILDLLDKILPNIFNRHPSSDFALNYKNYDTTYSEAVLCEYMDKGEMKINYIKTILEFIDDINSPIRNAKGRMLYSAFNKSPKNYLHFIAVTACMEVCTHIYSRGME